ncbi:MAG: hypothetical protein ACJ73S_00670 [Mycobacteriales bacterium]
MYVELKTGFDDDGPAWIGRVRFSKTGRTVYYRGRTLRRVIGVEGNHVDVDSGEEFWVSGPRRDRADRRYGNAPVQVDEDVRAEYETILASSPTKSTRAGLPTGPHMPCYGCLSPQREAGVPRNDRRSADGSGLLPVLPHRMITAGLRYIGQRPGPASPTAAVTLSLGGSSQSSPVSYKVIAVSMSGRPAAAVMPSQGPFHTRGSQACGAGC